MKNVFIIGSKGIPGRYGGFETFVEKLTENQSSKDIKYHVSCIGIKKEDFEHNGARCFTIDVPNIGPAKAILYDIKAINECIRYIRFNNIENAIVYVLACRIGPFIKKASKELGNLGAKLFVNPDGHEWKRAKWNWVIKKYWKLSERLMVKHSDFLICDSKNIEKYIREEYKQYSPKTTFIAYGADVEKESISHELEKLREWYKKNEIKRNEYYLVVGRFVPENNYELILTEFIKSKADKDLVLITNVENNSFYKKLKEKTNFDNDKRIKFVGTVYDQELLAEIRENAYGYIHGHEVGGTNPSLLEALAKTKLNLLLNVGFNREVAEEGAVYFDKNEGSLANLINHADKEKESFIIDIEKKAKSRILNYYTWGYIVSLYETLFINGQDAISNKQNNIFEPVTVDSYY